MDEQTVKSKRKVTFGKARVRLVFDYYNQDSIQSEDKDEKTSREIARMKQTPPHPQKQPKSILKPSRPRAVSVDTGLNALHRVPKRNFEWEKMDKNFWEPAKHKGSGRRHDSTNNRELENSDTKSKNDMLKKDDKSVAKQESTTNSSEGEITMASNKDENENDESSTEKPAVKNNEKWEGATASVPAGLSMTSVGIYSGVEADWDQTRQSLSRIGVDVGENKLQNPREFVAIMNMLLSAQKEKSDDQTVRGTEQDNIVVDHPTELRDSNNNKIVREHKMIPEDPGFGPNEDQVIKEELISAKQGATHKIQKPATSKEELKKRIKKLKMKGLIPGKKEKIRKERSYSEDNLNYLPRTEGNVKNYQEHSSFDRFRSRMKMNSSNSSSKFEKDKRRGPKRSNSEDNLDNFSKFEVEKTGQRDDCSSIESYDTEPECSSTDSSSTAHKETHFYSDSGLDLPRRVSLDDSSKRERSFSCPRAGGSDSLGEDLKHKKERPRVVKRDSWFLIKKQQMKGESEERSNLKDENLKGRKVIEGDDRKGGIDSERQFNIRGGKSFVEVQEASTSGSKFENRNKSSKQKMKRESSPKSDGRSNPKEGQNRKRESDSESQLKITQRKKHCGQVNEDSTSSSGSVNGNKSSKEHKSKQTLLTIANHTGLEDSGLSASTSIETIQSGPGNEQSTANIVENNNENTHSKLSKSKPGSSLFNQCQVQKTTQVYAEISPPLPENKEHPGVTRDSRCLDKAEHFDADDSVKESETNRIIGQQKDIKTTSKNTETSSDPMNGNNQNSNHDELLVDKKFRNDIRFIDAETKRSLRSEEYLERARKRYRRKRSSCLETNLAGIVMVAISKNPAAGILLPFTN